MPYLQFIGRAVDPCTVILLTSLDELPMVNEAPYAITTNPGGYSIDTAIKKFGGGAFGGGSSGAVHRIDFTGQPGGGVKGNGSLQIEFWYQRTGGTGAQAFGNQWDTDFYLEFDDGTWVQFVIGNASYFTAPNYRRTLYIAVSSAVSGYDEHRTADIDFLPDDDFHAIRFAMTGAGAFAMLVDGAIVASGTLTATVPAGARIVDMAWGDVRTGQRMDEARVILGAADLAEYTPALGPWATADCDSEAPTEGTPSSLLLKFDSGLLVDQNSTRTNTLTANGSPTAVTTDQKWGTHSAHFDSTSNENIDVLSPSDFRVLGEEATIDFWFNSTTAGSNNAQVLRNALFTISTDVPVHQNPGNNVVFWFWWNTNSSGTFGFGSGTLATGVTAGVWHHVRMCIYANGSASIFLNGTRVQTLAAGAAPAFDAVSIGNQLTAGLEADGLSASNVWRGFIDSVRIITGTALEPAPATTMTVPTADFPNV